MFDWNKVFSQAAYEFKINDIDAEITSDFVKELRRKLNLSQKMFAKVLGVSEKTIEKWEQGSIKVKRTASRLLYLLSKHEELLDDLYLVKREDEMIQYQGIYYLKTVRVKKSKQHVDNEQTKFLPQNNKRQETFLCVKNNSTETI